MGNDVSFSCKIVLALLQTLVSQGERGNKKIG